MVSPVEDWKKVKGRTIWLQVLWRNFAPALVNSCHDYIGRDEGGREGGMERLFNAPEVSISEMSHFRDWKCMQGLFLGKDIGEVSSFQGCP